jgi:hypothetical protein
MSRWILSLALVSLMACDPNKGPGFRPGGSTDDTDQTDDTGWVPTDCAPTFGEIVAEIDDYPGKGWVVEVTAPFTEGSCSMADGSLYIEHDDGSGGTATEGPFSIGFDTEDVFIQEYDDAAGTGKLFFAFFADGATEQVVFTMWVAFGDGSSSEHVEVTAG